MDDAVGGKIFVGVIGIPFGVFWDVRVAVVDGSSNQGAFDGSPERVKGSDHAADGFFVHALDSVCVGMIPVRGQENPSFGGGFFRDAVCDEGCIHGYCLVGWLLLVGCWVWADCCGLVLPGMGTRGSSLAGRERW